MALRIYGDNLASYVHKQRECGRSISDIATEMKLKPNTLTTLLNRRGYIIDANPITPSKSFAKEVYDYLQTHKTFKSFCVERKLNYKKYLAQFNKAGLTMNLSSKQVVDDWKRYIG